MSASDTPQPATLTPDEARLLGDGNGPAVHEMLTARGLTRREAIEAKRAWWRTHPEAAAKLDRWAHAIMQTVR